MEEICCCSPQSSYTIGSPEIYGLSFIGITSSPISLSCPYTDTQKIKIKNCSSIFPGGAGSVFTPNDDLAEEVFKASEVSGEKLWRLPLEDSYWESMKSGVADMVNTGARQGGAITAALFLKQFVDEKVQWMHMDIADPVWNDKKKSATGFGVSTLVEWVMKNSS